MSENNNTKITDNDRTDRAAGANMLSELKKSALSPSKENVIRLDMFEMQWGFGAHQVSKSTDYCG